MLALVVYILSNNGEDIQVSNMIHRFERRQPSVREIRDLEYSLNPDHIKYRVKIINIIELRDENKSCLI